MSNALFIDTTTNVEVRQLQLGDEARSRGVYCAWDGLMLVVLLGGGTKQRQNQDIQAALANWRNYKARKKAGEGEQSRCH